MPWTYLFADPWFSQHNIRLFFPRGGAYSTFSLPQFSFCMWFRKEVRSGTLPINQWQRGIMQLSRYLWALVVRPKFGGSPLSCGSYTYFLYDHIFMPYKDFLQCYVSCFWFCGTESYSILLNSWGFHFSGQILSRGNKCHLFVGRSDYITGPSKGSRPIFPTFPTCSYHFPQTTRRWRPCKWCHRDTAWGKSNRWDQGQCGQVAL